MGGIMSMFGGAAGGGSQVYANGVSGTPAGGGLSAGNMAGLMGGGAPHGQAQADQLGMSALGQYQNMSNYANMGGLMNTVLANQLGSQNNMRFNAERSPQQEISPNQYVQSLMRMGMGG